MKTYLDLVNQVLVEIREEEAATVAQDEFSKLVGNHVNRAKAQVEDAHDWSALLTDITFDSVVGQSKYSLTNSNNRAIIDGIVNTTNRNIVVRTPRRWITTEYNLGSVPSSTPTKWANSGVDASGDAQIVLYPLPSAIESYNVSCFVRTPDFTTDLDELVIPFRPVVDLAVAFAVRERGEVVGQTAAEYFELAKRSLSDEIAYDAARNADEDDWYWV